MDNNLNRIILFSFFFILGMFAHRLFFDQKPKVITKIDTVTDTVYVQKIDTIRITNTQIRHQVVRDTVIIDFKPKISRFETSFPTTYGNALVNGKVLGEVLKMDLITDFRFPVVTNTITKTNTVIKKPQGLYVGSGLQVGGSNFSVSANLIYLQDKNLFGYSYSLYGGHGVMYGRKIF